MSSKVKCERYVEQEANLPKPKSLWPPAIVCVIGLCAIFWVYNHVAGGCLEAKDVLHYCEFTPPTVSH